MILVTGGCGYIGSHCVLALLEKGYEVLIFDNFSTGNRKTLEVLKKIGKEKLYFEEIDLLDFDKLIKVMQGRKIDGVFHFASFSQVGESISNPSKYYRNNILGAVNLLDVMIQLGINNLIFSSTAAIYGEPKYIPIDENHPKNPINPYGKSKIIIEQIMDDYDKVYDLKSVRLRYFNVAGADNKAKIGELHNPETHLIPNILKSTLGTNKEFQIFGTDYDTKDGTCIRDYINIEDLINAHLLAFDYLISGGKSDSINLGTGKGNSVKEVFDLCKKITQKDIPIKYMDKRPGDPAILLADNKKAKQVLNWEPNNTLEYSIKTAYSFFKKNTPGNNK